MVNDLLSSYISVRMFDSKFNFWRAKHLAELGNFLIQPPLHSCWPRFERDFINRVGIFSCEIFESVTVPLDFSLEKWLISEVLSLDGSVWW